MSPSPVNYFSRSFALKGRTQLRRATWRHVAFQFDAVGDKVSVFIDGMLMLQLTLDPGGYSTLRTLNTKH